MKNNNIQQYIGKKRNHWIILGTVEPKMSPTKRRQAVVKCDCGDETVYYKDWNSIVSGISKSCGCERINSNKSRSGNNNTKIQASLQKYIGQIYPTNEGYHVEVVSLRNTHDVTVRFQEVDYEISSTTMQNVKNGQLKYPYKENSYGGVYGNGNYTARTNTSKNISYSTWFSMLNRCGHTKAYKDCFVSEEWRNYQNFAEWYEENIYEYNGRLTIDKDILVPFNKQYGPNTCVIIPFELNSVFVKPIKKPILIHEKYMVKRYNVLVNQYQKQYFDNLQQANEAYEKNTLEWLHIKKDHFLEKLSEYHTKLPKKVYQKLKNAIENY